MSPEGVASTTHRVDRRWVPQPAFFLARQLAERLDTRLTAADP
ncbi:hypothetical protein [Streptomyces nojiriensis]|nr:hypothetical protein [Streptomyces nojiriensis]QTI43723.1 hypothetical protein JYK04_01486 [Streptomyces nojiriensis]